MSMKTNNPRFRRAFERGILRSAFKSLFWAVIVERKKRPEGFRLTELAKAVSSSKHEVSRWFNGDPNWTINTIANVADALNVDLRIQAVDRKTGAIFTPAGLQTSAEITRPVNLRAPVETTAFIMQPSFRVTRGASSAPETSTFSRADAA
jgi:transcriptional regulator with XRE-family HTH domain